MRAGTELLEGDRPVQTEIGNRSDKVQQGDRQWYLESQPLYWVWMSSGESSGVGMRFGLMRFDVGERACWCEGDELGREIQPQVYFHP